MSIFVPILILARWCSFQIVNGKMGGNRDRYFSLAAASANMNAELIV